MNLELKVLFLNTSQKPPADFTGICHFTSGTIHWYKEGHLHRENDQPAVYKPQTLRKEWWINGRLHRKDGPAVIGSDGSETWYQRGLIHREDGPAIVIPTGEKKWFQDGKLHRLNGPAIIQPCGIDYNNYYYINGVQFNETSFREEVKRLTIKDYKKFMELPSTTQVNGVWNIPEIGKYHYDIYQNKLHRTDGPAVELCNGENYYFFQGHEFTKEEFEKRIKITLSDKEKLLKLAGIDNSCIVHNDARCDDL